MVLRTVKCVTACGALLLAWSLGTPTVEAHWADQAVAEIKVEAAQARITLTFPTSLAIFADDDHDGQLSAQEVRRHRAELETFLGQHIRVADGDARGALAVEPASTGDVTPGPGTHSTLLLVYRWSKPIKTLAIQYELFVPGVSTASCLATIVYGGQVRTFVFTPERRTLTLASGTASLWHQGISFTALGIRHILTGHDHMLFLVSLLMLGGGLRSLLKTVTAFTVAHSVTLSLTALGIATLPLQLRPDSRTRICHNFETAGYLTGKPGAVAGELQLRGRARSDCGGDCCLSESRCARRAAVGIHHAALGVRRRCGDRDRLVYPAGLPGIVYLLHPERG